MDFRIKLALWVLMFIIFVICCIIIVIRNVFNVLEYHEQRINELNIKKQDDTSAYITDDEWYDLCKQYGFEWNVKPYHQITHDSAVRLLEYLKQRTSE